MLRALVFMLCLVAAPAFAAPKTLVAQGTLKSVVDGAVLIATKAGKAEVAQLERRGFRVVSSEKQIADRTIFRGEAYVAYSLAPTIEAPGLDRLMGQRVRCQIERAKDGQLWVVSIGR